MEELFILWTKGWENKYFATEGQGKKYFMNKREVIITLLIDDFWKLKEGNNYLVTFELKEEK